MKFLCDRCKTRYSIGDDRVRGKILKIRCKNCANVITVREGMPDADAVQAADAATTADAQAQGQPRRGRSTTQAPNPDVAISTNGNRGNALGAAFANAMTKPPPALEEEWYVSIDGDQSGPYTLAEAQRWVASKGFDAELHCWSEGFDDWLPVDKVSHFRGLRKKPPPPPAPPPLPRVGTASGPARAVMTARAAPPQPQLEEEPKPLFAATMASLEKSAIAAQSAHGALAPAVTPRLPDAKRPSATPPTGQPALHVHTNGTPRIGAAPAVARPLTPSAAMRTNTAQGMGAVKALRFDQSEGELGDSTQIEAAPFSDEPKTAAEPIASLRKAPVPLAQLDKRAAFAHDAGLRDAGATTPDVPAAAIAAAAARPESQSDDSDGDIDIGEVSRVVNLADLVRSAPRSQAAKRTGSVAKLPQSGGSNPMIGRSTASTPKLVGGTVPVTLFDAVDVVPGANGLAPPVADIAHDVAAPTSHRKAMIALLIGGLLFVGGMVVVFVFMFGNQPTDEEKGLGGDYELNNERPDQLVRRPGDPIPPVTNPVDPPPNPFVPKRPPKAGSNTVKPIDPIPPPTGNSLKAEEIEQMAAKFAGVTTSCFRRADKGVDAILLADVKKITVTLDVAPEGGVSTVALSNNGSDKLGKCLTGMIKSWKFRTSPGGTYRFVLAKPD